MITPIFELKEEARSIERILSNYMGQRVEVLRKVHGDAIANEIVMSVAALISARSVGMIHVWTGEKIDRITKRLIETMNDDLKPTMKKILAVLAEEEGKPNDQNL